jgi:HemY protein
MRAAVWLLGLFGVAVALALFASGNGATITVYWPPHRVDLSLNFVLLLLLLLFLLLHLALRALAALLAMPQQAQSWRLRHQERGIHSALLDALSHLIAGRFIRARKAAELVLARDSAMTRQGDSSTDAARLRVLAHLLVAESAQALQDKGAREKHFQAALEQASSHDASGTREGVLLRAVRWALEDRTASAALDWLDQLPSGVARRTVALRMRLKVARLAGRIETALETARLLIKHRAFPPSAAQSLVRALAVEWLQTATDPQRLGAIWARLEPAEQHMPEVATVAAGRLLRLGGDVHTAFGWLQPVWEQMVNGDGLSVEQAVVLIRVMENGLSGSRNTMDTQWLSRIEHAQRQRPGDANLQYLAGVACLNLELWGKAQQLIRQALPRLSDAGLLSRGWQMLAELAQRQGDEAQAAQAWRNASQATLLRKS